MDNTVEAAKAFRKFFFLVLFCVFLGNILSRVAQRFLDEKWTSFSRSLHEKKIEASRPQIIFSRFGVPTLGALIENLTYETETNCFKYRVRAENLFLPLKLSKLLLLKPEFGPLNVEKTRFEFHESIDCSETSRTTEVSTSGDGFEDVVAKVPLLRDEKKSVEIPPQWFKHLSDWFLVHHPRLHRMPIQKFRLQSLEVQGETLKEKRINGLGSLSVNLDTDLSAELHFEKLILGKTTRSVATQFKAELKANSEEIRIVGDWAYYEGHLIADLQFNRRQAVNLRLTSQNLPLSVLNRWFDTPWTFQFLWFNCGFRLNAVKHKWSQSPWAIENCAVSGPHGEIVFSSEKTTSLEKFDHLQAQIINLQLDRIFKGKEQLPLSGVWKDFGVLRGTFTARGDQIESDWNVQNSSVIFSRKNKRLLQEVDSLSGRFEYSKGLYSFAILKAKILDGLFKGRIDVAYDKKQKNIRGTVAVDELLFSPPIQQLMLAGEVSPVKVNGDVSGQLESSQWVGKMQFALQNYKNSYLQAQQISLLLGWLENVPQLALTIDQANIDASDEVRWVFASLLQEAQTRKRLRLQQIYLKGLFEDKNKFSLEKSTAYAPGLGRLQMVGAIDASEGRGTAKWQLLRGPPLDWEWSYRSQDSTWIPQTKEMREWLSTHDDFMAEYPFIR